MSIVTHCHTAFGELHLWVDLSHSTCDVMISPCDVMISTCDVMISPCVCSASWQGVEVTDVPRMSRLTGLLT